MRGGNYCRVGAGIANYDNMQAHGRPEVTEFNSINKAKHASWLMQVNKEGGLGRGCLYIGGKLRRNRNDS